MRDRAPGLSLEEDAALLRAWCQGDKAAGDRLIRHHFDRISQSVLRWVHGDTTVAMDIVQATFERALETKAKIRGSFGPYVRGIARVKVLEHFRRHDRIVEELTASMRTDSVGVESALLNAEQERLAVKALRQLSEEQQGLLYLRYVQGMKLRELAQVQGMTVGRIDGILRRALDRLARQIEHLAESPDLGQSTLMGMSSWLREHGDDRVAEGPDEPAVR